MAGATYTPELASGLKNPSSTLSLNDATTPTKLLDWVVENTIHASTTEELSATNEPRITLHVTPDRLWKMYYLNHELLDPLNSLGGVSGISFGSGNTNYAVNLDECKSKCDTRWADGSFTSYYCIVAFLPGDIQNYDITSSGGSLYSTFRFWFSTPTSITGSDYCFFWAINKPVWVDNVKQGYVSAYWSDAEQFTVNTDTYTPELNSGLNDGSSTISSGDASTPTTLFNWAAVNTVHASTTVAVASRIEVHVTSDPPRLVT